MYLVDSELTNRLDELAIVSPDGDAFSAERQIGPCSIDLRLSDTYWEPRVPRRWPFSTKKPLDLRIPGDLTQATDWRLRKVRAGDGILLRPRQLLLCRTLEEFTIPEDCAGKLEGRSSYARLGLLIHAAADFINPGWRGHMPLQIVNLTDRPIRLIGRTAICQLMLVPLSSRPEKSYIAGERTYASESDDGGPSRWWLDPLYKALKEELVKVDRNQRLCDDVLSLMKDEEPQLALSMLEYVRRRRLHDVTNLGDAVTKFTKWERMRRWSRELYLWGPRALGTAAFGVLVGVWNAGDWRWVCVAALALFAALSLHGKVSPPPARLSNSQLDDLAERAARLP